MKKIKEHEPWKPFECQLGNYHYGSADTATVAILRAMHIVRTTDGYRVKV